MVTAVIQDCRWGARGMAIPRSKAFPCSQVWEGRQDCSNQSVPVPHQIHSELSCSMWLALRPCNDWSQPQTHLHSVFETLRREGRCPYFPASGTFLATTSSGLGTLVTLRELKGEKLRLGLQGLSQVGMERGLRDGRMGRARALLAEKVRSDLLGPPCLYPAVSWTDGASLISWGTTESMSAP